MTSAPLKPTTRQGTASSPRSSWAGCPSLSALPNPVATSRLIGASGRMVESSGGRRKFCEFAHATFEVGRDRLNADVIRTGVDVLLNAGIHRVNIAVGDERVDQAVAAAVREVVVGEP